jgi:nucleoside-diphosphate-sugar epimerase
MRIFVAGASGVIGRRAVGLLLGQGHQVTGVTRRPAQAAAIQSAGAQAAVVDVYDAKALAEAVRAARPDVVMHQLTDLSGGDRTANARVRQAGTRNLVDAALAAGVRRVIAQSIAWAYEPGLAPATEDVPLDLHSDADRLSTVSGIATLEKIVREVPEWVILRYGMFYGPSTWYTTGGLMAESAQSGRLLATADVTSFVHVDDAAAAAVAALEWPSAAVNICDDEPAAGYDWVPHFCEQVGAPEPSPSDSERTGWARGADNHYARKHLNWTPQWLSWRDGFVNR